MFEEKDIEGFLGNNSIKLKIIIKVRKNLLKNIIVIWLNVDLEKWFKGKSLSYIFRGGSVIWIKVKR